MPPRAVIASPISSARRNVTVIAAASRSINSAAQLPAPGPAAARYLFGPQPASGVEHPEFVDQHREGAQRESQRPPPTRRPGSAAT